MPKENLEDTDDAEDTESEETEESTEDEDAEDTEESSEEEESEESDDEEKEDESATEESSEQFLDLNKLPPQLREAGRRMLATHSKALAKVKSQYETWKNDTEKELQDTYAAAIVKANGFDKLTGLDQFKLFWKDLEAGRPYGYSSSLAKTGESGSGDDSSADRNGKGNDVDAIVDRILPRVTKLIEEAVLPLKKVHINNQWDSAEKNLPNFNKYRARITSILSEHPTLSLEQAYELAAGKDRVNVEIEKALKDAAERGKKVPKSTLKSSSSGMKPLTTESVKDISDAIRLASKKVLLGAGG